MKLSEMHGVRRFKVKYRLQIMIYKQRTHLSLHNFTQMHCIDTDNMILVIFVFRDTWKWKRSILFTEFSIKRIISAHLIIAKFSQRLSRNYKKPLSNILLDTTISTLLLPTKNLKILVQYILNFVSTLLLTLSSRGAKPC